MVKRGGPMTDSDVQVEKLNTTTLTTDMQLLLELPYLLGTVDEDWQGNPKPASFN